jgi:hypothetical protein
MKIYSTLVLALSLQLAKAQDLAVGPFSGVNNIGKITVVGGQVNFADINGAPNDQRIYAAMASALPDAFTASFNFTVTQAGTYGSSLIPLAFTAGSQAVSNPQNSPSVQTAQDALGVVFETPKYNDVDLMLKPYIKKGATVQPISAAIAIQKNVAYKVVLQRCSPTAGALSVFQGDALLKQIAFTINQPLQPLVFAQASNMVQAWERRLCSALASDYKFVAGALMPCITINTLCDPTPIKKPIVTQPTKEVNEPVKEKTDLLEVIGNVIKQIDRQTEEQKPVQRPTDIKRPTEKSSDTSKPAPKTLPPAPQSKDSKTKGS